MLESEDILTLGRSSAAPPDGGRPSRRVRCCMPFTTGKPCTYRPLAGHDVCVHHALQYLAERSGEDPAAMFDRILTGVIWRHDGT